MPEEKKEKTTKPTPFETALAAKRGAIPKDSLRGAARLLYNQHSEEELIQYSKPRADRSESRPHIFSSRGMMRGKG